MNLHTKITDLFCGSGELFNKCVKKSIKKYNNDLTFKFVNSNRKAVYLMANTILNDLCNEIYALAKIQNLFCDYLNNIFKSLSVEEYFRTKSEIIKIIQTKKFHKEVNHILQYYIDNNEDFDVNIIANSIQFQVYNSLLNSNEYKYILSIQLNKKKSKIKNMILNILKLGGYLLKSFTTKIIMNTISKILFKIINDILKFQPKVVYS